MPSARVFAPPPQAVPATLTEAFEAAAARWSDIREYLPLLHATAASYRKCRVLELGTRTGLSTLAFLAAAEKTGGHVWSVDADPADEDPQGMGPWRDCLLWTFTRGDDLHPSVRAAQPPRVDVLFVDTSHTYEHTLAELDAYMPRMAPGGVALFHDTHLLFRDLDRTTAVPPVGQALDDWCAANGMKWADLPGSYGMGVIKIPAEVPDAC